MSSTPTTEPARLILCDCNGYPHTENCTLTQVRKSGAYKESSPAQPAAVDKATPRPWRYGLVPEDAQNRYIQESPRSGDRYFIGPENDGSDICEVHHTYERGDPGTSEANAQLIVRSVNQAAVVDALVDSVDVLLSNWPVNRDGMDYKELPAGLQSTRAALAAVEQLRKLNPRAYSNEQWFKPAEYPNDVVVCPLCHLPETTGVYAVECPCWERKAASL